jgi:hypothetical protein
MTEVEKMVLVENYNMDSSSAYELTSEQLYVLMAQVGEMEPIIDALNVLSGASVEQRARDIGCQPEDFHEYWDNDDEIIAVEELDLAASIPWSYGV